MAIDARLAGNIGAPIDIGVQNQLLLQDVLSQTTLQERASLYALTRWGYRGIGEVVDVGCAAGGSTYCLALGLQHRQSEEPVRKVLAFDLFGGYSLEAFRQRMPSDAAFESDLELFEWVTRDVRQYVSPQRMNIVESLRTFFEPTRKVELAHIDAAKSLDLWRAIASVLLTRVIPGHTVWVFQDFERARLFWQVVSLGLLLNVGEFIGGANYGTMYFRFTAEPSERISSRIEQFDFSLDDCLRLVERVFELVRRDYSQAFTPGAPLSDVHRAVCAYCYWHHGDVSAAREHFLQTSERFRAHPSNQRYTRDILGTG